MSQNVISLDRATYEHKTFTFSDNTVKSLSDILMTMTDERGNPATGCLITCESNNIRFTSDGKTLPTSGAIGHILYAQQSLHLTNWHQIKNFKLRNAVDGANAKVNVSMESDQ